MDCWGHLSSQPIDLSAHVTACHKPTGSLEGGILVAMLHREMTLQNPYRYVVPSTFVSARGSWSCTARDEVCSPGDNDGHKHL